MEKNTNDSSLKIENFSFCYPNREKPALKNISFSLKQGDFAVLCGLSGCGKTTLLRQCKPALAAHGEKNGTIYLNGEEIEKLSVHESASKIGFVQQNPDNQIVTDKVWHELAFGLEGLGYDTQAIRLRVAEMASFFGISDWFYRSVSELSGGQKQLLALACVMVMQPSLLILDEPTAQLDPIAASEFLSAVHKINRELGVTVLMTEHRLEEAFPICSRALVMDNGEIIFDGAPFEAGEFLRRENHEMFAAMPTPMRIWASVKSDLPCPITVRDGREWLSNMEIKGFVKIEEDYKAGKAAVELDDVWFKYEKRAPDVIKGLNFSASFGDVTAILGGNGTGKTTTLSLISGLNKAYRGKVKINGNPIEKMRGAELYNHLIGVLPQNPQTLFTENTVEKDLNEILTESNLSKNERKEKVEEAAMLCGISGLLKSHPYDLSGGEQQRAALAKVLLLEPQILLLDEPTKGFDAEFKQIFAEILDRLKRSGKAIIMVSHDVEFCAEYADRCALFFDGSVVTEGTPHKFFSGNSFYTTAANRMSRHVIPNAVTAHDVITVLGGDDSKSDFNNNDFFHSPYDEIKKEANKNENEFPKNGKSNFFIGENKKSKLSKKTITAFLMIFLAMPLTIFIGVYVFDDRKIYFTSLLIILESMVPFGLLFESRKPQARELVLLAVLTTIAVAGRAAFFMIPQFKPVIAIVIIAGISFGGEAGFLVGALSGFISNMMFGQGPWTPWQMFAFGLIGFLAGVIFKKGMPKYGKTALCIFGAFSAFVIYGGLLNLSGVLTYQSYPTVQMLAAACIQALPFDAVHAAATVFFLAVISKPMLEKLDRIKIKYGLINAN